MENQAGTDVAHTNEMEYDDMKIDTVHLDEAVKTMADYHGNQEWDAKEERRLIRRIDFRLLPILAASYGLQYYDKSLISQAVGVPK